MRTMEISFTYKKKPITIKVALPESLQEAAPLMTGEQMLTCIQDKLIAEAKLAAVRTRPRKRWLKLDLLSENGKRASKILAEAGLKLL